MESEVIEDRNPLLAGPSSAAPPGPRPTTFRSPPAAQHGATMQERTARGSQPLEDSPLAERLDAPSEDGGASQRSSSSFLNLLQQGSQTMRWNWSSRQHEHHRKHTRRSLSKHIRSITRASHHTAAVVRLGLVQLAASTGSRLAIAAAFVAESVDGVFDLPKTLYNSPARQRAYLLWHKASLLRHANLIMLLLISLIEVPLWCINGGFDWNMHFLWDRQQKCFHDGKPLYISGIPFLSVEVGLVFEAVGLALMTIDFVVHVWWSGGVSMAQLCTAHFRTTEARDYATLTLLKGLTIACSIVEWLVFIIMGPERYSNVFNIRLGGYFRLCLICLYSRHIRTNLRVILLMMPNFLEVVLLLVLFVFFCAWIALVGYRDSETISGSFYDIWESAWSLLVLLTTSNNPSLWIIAYDKRNVDGLFFLLYLLIGVLCISPLLLSVVVNTYMTSMAKLLVGRVVHRDVVLNAAFDILDIGKRGRISLNRWRELHGLYMSYCGEELGSLDVHDHGDVEELDGHIAMRVHRTNYQADEAGDLHQPLLGSITERRSVDADHIEDLREGLNGTRVQWDDATPEEAALGNVSVSDDDMLTLRDFKALCAQLPLLSGKASVSKVSQKRPQSRRFRSKFAAVRLAWQRARRASARVARVGKALLEVVVGSSLFEALVYVLLGVNFVMLLMETVRDKGWEVGKGWVTGNFLVSGLFIAEILMRIGAYGFGEFWEFADNRINFVLSLVVFTAQGVLISVGEGKSVWYEIASMAQLLRFVRIIARVSRYQRILYTLSLVAGPLSRLAGVIFCFLFLFSLIGMECFGARIYNDVDCKYSPVPPQAGYDVSPIKRDCVRGNPLLNGTAYAEEKYYALNFNDMGSSLLTVFNLLFVNDWYVTVGGFVAVMQSRWARMYFVAFYILVVCALLNVAVAMMLQAFAAHVKDTPEEMDQHPSMTKLPKVATPRSPASTDDTRGMNASDRSQAALSGSSHAFTYFNRKASDYMDVMSIVLRPEVERLCET